MNAPRRCGPGGGRRAGRLGTAAVLALLALGAGLLSACGGESDPGRMNIVVVMTDDQPLRSVRDMPYMREAADRGWTRFDNAVVNNALCCPSRVTHLTGLFSHHSGVDENADAPDFDPSGTIATRLQDAGYDTALIGKYLNGYPWKKGADYVPAGWDRWVSLQGEPDYYDYTLSIDGRPERFGNAEEDYVSRVIERRALDFMGEHDSSSDAPFFLFVPHFAPHRPVQPDPRIEGELAGKEIPLAPSVGERDVSDKPAWIQERTLRPNSVWRPELRIRAETTLSVDRLLRRITAELERSGELENTLLLFTTDHGYALGEHRFKRKSCAYEECVGVPLFIRLPGAAEAGERLGELVSNADFASTYADVAEIDFPDVDGTSLVPLLDGESLPADRAIPIQKAQPGGESPPYWGVRTRDAKYVELETGERELYLLDRDPFELRNRIDDPELADLREELAARLAELKR